MPAVAVIVVLVLIGHGQDVKVAVGVVFKAMPLQTVHQGHIEGLAVDKVEIGRDSVKVRLRAEADAAV